MYSAPKQVIEQGKSDWFKSFFTEPWLSIQKAVWTPDRTIAEVDFIQHVLRLPRLAAILDVPCGDGRIAVELAGLCAVSEF
jgi:D-alanine-D-alanine ligase